MRRSAWAGALLCLALSVPAVAQSDAPAIAAEEPETAADAAPPGVVEAPAAAAPEPLPSFPTPRELYDRYAPALVLVRYIANVQGAEGGARAARQIGVVVKPDGLVLLGGYLQALNLKPVDFHVRTGQDEDATEYDGTLLSRVGDLNVSYVQIARPEPVETNPDAATPAGDGDAPTPAAEPFPFVAFDTDPTLDIGDEVWVFGVLPEQADSALRMRKQRVAAVLREPSTVYVLDGAPTPAESGGLVVSSAGEPVGVLGYELSAQQGGELYVRHSLPLVFPAAALRESIATPREESLEKDEESWFGVLIQPLREDFKEYFGLEDETGCIITNVVSGSPADAAGLARGDILVEMDGEPIDVPNDLALLTFTRAVRDMPAGTVVKLKYLRDGEERETTLELEAQPKMAAKADTFRQPAWGLRVRELTQDIIYILNLPRDLTGVVVDQVEQGGPAQAAGLQPGDVIRELNGHALDDLADYRDSTDQLAAMRSEDIVLFVQRGSRTGFTKLAPDWSLPAREE